MAVLGILKDVLSIPTAPFHEWEVMAFIGKFCGRLGLPVKVDKAGNIIVRYKRGRAKQPVVFAAHMDHPGFEVIMSKGANAEVGILGSINLKQFRGSKVLIKTDGGLVKGTVVRRLRNKRWRGKPVFRVKLNRGVRVSPGDFGYYDLMPLRVRGDFIYTKAADNLVSCSLLLELLKNLVKGRVRADVSAVFTRAEEVGFVGCIHLVEAGLLRKSAPIIVLECSSAKAGCVGIGDGPVVRVGDKKSGFDPAIDAWISSNARKLSVKKRGFKFQRALLAGGSCEASAYLLKDYCVGGLAFPLGNYHNVGARRPVEEYVSLNDYRNMLSLVLALSKAGRFREALPAKKKELWKNYRFWKDRLW